MVHTEAGVEKNFDGEELAAVFMDDREAARSILGRFITRTGEQIRILPEIEGREDWESARREAHTIKGGALTLSGRALGGAAVRLETAYLEPDHSGIAAARAALEEAFVRFRERAEAWLRAEGS